MFADTILDPAGPIAAAQRDLLFDATGLMLIVVVPVFVLTAAVVRRYREGNSRAVYTPAWSSSRYDGLTDDALRFPVRSIVARWAAEPGLATGLFPASASSALGDALFQGDGIGSIPKVQVHFRVRCFSARTPPGRAGSCRGPGRCGTARH